MSDAALVVLYGVAALVSAFFSAAETALTSVSEANVFRFREEGRRGVESLERLRANLARTIGTLLVGNNIANTAAGSIGAAIAIGRFGERWGILVATAVTAVVILVVAEVTPKTLAARRSGVIALALARPIEIAVTLFSPLTTLIAGAANFILRPLGGGTPEAADVTEADVKSLISLGHEQGMFEKEEKEILHAFLEFGDTPVRDAMVPRARMVSLSVGAEFEAVEALCREHRYSRFPVYRESPDDVVGVLHVKDLFDVTDEEERRFDLARYLRPAVFVPELKRAGDLFREMRRRRFHLALVVDELGAISGLVTLEDLVEEVLGDIADEHDEPTSRPKADGASVVIEGGYALAALERDFALSLDEPDVETVAGLLLKKFGRIPRTGEKARVAELELLVERASPRAIERVRITRAVDAAAGGERKAS